MTKSDQPNLDRKILYQNDFFEIVSIAWNDESIPRIHNHGWSQCLVLIEEGAFENTLDMGNKVEVQRLEKGNVLETPVGARHALKCLSRFGKTLHIYTPKIIEHSDGGRFCADPELSYKLKADLELSAPTEIEKLKNILTHIKNESISTHSPFFMNQLFSGVLPQMLLAEDLINQCKTTMATQEASSAFSLIEAEVIEALGALIGWEKNSRDGVSVPGGSAANAMALHCARHKYFPQIKTQGTSGERLKIFVSSEAHYSFKKACVFLGIGSDALVTVPADEMGRMLPDELRRLILISKSQGEMPFFVCATAGTTVMGSFDPILSISNICRELDLWLHVDGAWGGPAIFSKRLKPLVYGIELADSMTFDAHKLFGANLTCSFFLTSHIGILTAANDVSGGEYIFHKKNDEDNFFEIDRGKVSWQCGRRADATSFWTIWKSLGTDGLEKFIDKLLDVKNETLEWIKNQQQLELVGGAEFLNVCVRILPTNGDIAQWSSHVRETLKSNNKALVNYSLDEKGTFLRLILVHPYLEFEHVKQILEWAQEVE